ncbi:MAG TPA: hypothetical protein VMZ91_09700 [Candidatus Paceibacterota bacterium]|nr:hypothetical protein [Candidatus Paceibacterota bacterium]
MKKIPIKALALSFNYYQRNAYNIYYGEPIFYDKEGNILKDCSGIRLWTKQ